MRAIVLHTVKYGDSQLIIDLLTEADGRVAFIQKISTGGRGRIRKQLFQPLTLLDIEYEPRPRTQLQKLRDVRLLHPFATIPFDPYKLSICIFVAEFLLYATRNEQANRPLFDYVEASLRWLDGCKTLFANFHLVFMLRLTLFVGFFPNLEEWHEGGYFDLRSACFTDLRPMHSDFLQPDDAAKVRLLMRMNFDNMYLFKMSRVERNQCVDIVLRYYRLHIPDFPELRSLAVVKTLYT